MGFGGREPITRRALLGGTAAGMIGLATAMGVQILALRISAALPRKECVFCRLTRIPPCARPRALR